MNFHVLTLFPELIEDSFYYSIMKRAADKGLISLKTVNIRDFSNNTQNRVDDYTYGGGCGMVMQPQPIYDAYNHVKCGLAGTPKVLYMSPQGKTLTQEMAKELSTQEDLIILCGHYEGVDQRVIDEIVTDEISIGDYVLTGGELAALVVIDAVGRLIPGVLGKEDSSLYESFDGGLLEYPQYTRPVEFLGREVPPVLLSGHHGNVQKWRREQAVIGTFKKRPDLMEAAVLTEEERLLIANIKKDKP